MQLRTAESQMDMQDITPVWDEAVFPASHFASPSHFPFLYPILEAFSQWGVKRLYLYIYFTHLKLKSRLNSKTK